MLTAMRKANDVAPQVYGSDVPAGEHPPLSEIPACRLPLRSEEARREYATIGRALLDAGRWGLETHIRLSVFASMFDTITNAVLEGKPVRASWFTQMQRALSALRLSELEKPPTPPQEAQPNRYAICGFAVRGGWSAR